MVEVDKITEDNLEMVSRIIIGELLLKDKYSFSDKSLLADVVRETVKFLSVERSAV